MRGIVQPQQSTGVPLRQNTSSYTALHQAGKLQEPQGVGDLRARTANALRKLVLRALEVFKKLLIGSGFFKRVEINSVKVFKKCIAKQVVVANIADDCRNLLETGFLRCAEPAFTHDQLVRRFLRIHHSHNYGLKNAYFFNGSNQFCQGIFIKDIARLAGVRRDLFDWNQAECCTGNVLQIRFT